MSRFEELEASEKSGNNNKWAREPALKPYMGSAPYRPERAKSLPAKKKTAASVCWCSRDFLTISVDEFRPQRSPSPRVNNAVSRGHNPSFDARLTPPSRPAVYKSLPLIFLLCVSVLPRKMRPLAIVFSLLVLIYCNFTLFS